MSLGDPRNHIRYHQPIPPASLTLPSVSKPRQQQDQEKTPEQQKQPCQDSSTVEGDPGKGGAGSRLALIPEETAPRRAGEAPLEKNMEGVHAGGDESAASPDRGTAGAADKANGKAGGGVDGGGGSGSGSGVSRDGESSSGSGGGSSSAPRLEGPAGKPLAALDGGVGGGIKTAPAAASSEERVDATTAGRARGAGDEILAAAPSAGGDVISAALDFAVSNPIDVECAKDGEKSRSKPLPNTALEPVGVVGGPGRESEAAPKVNTEAEGAREAGMLAAGAIVGVIAGAAAGGERPESDAINTAQDPLPATGDVFKVGDLKGCGGLTNEVRDAAAAVAPAAVAPVTVAAAAAAPATVTAAVEQPVPGLTALTVLPAGDAQALATASGAANDERGGASSGSAASPGAAVGLVPLSTSSALSPVAEAGEGAGDLAEEPLGISVSSQLVRDAFMSGKRDIAGVGGERTAGGEGRGGSDGRGARAGAVQERGGDRLPWTGLGGKGGGDAGGQSGAGSSSGGSDSGGSGGGGGGRGGVRRGGGLTIQAPTVASIGDGPGSRIRRTRSNSGSSSNSSIGSGSGSGSGGRGAKRVRDDAWHGAASGREDKATKERRTDS